jgi:hypothetical protein
MVIQLVRVSIGREHCARLIEGSVRVRLARRKRGGGWKFVGRSRQVRSACTAGTVRISVRRRLRPGRYRVTAEGIDLYGRRVVVRRKLRLWR